MNNKIKNALLIFFLLALIHQHAFAQSLPVDIVEYSYNPNANDLKAVRSILLRPQQNGQAFHVPAGSQFRASIYAPDHYLPEGESNMNYIKTEQMLTTSPVTTTNVHEKIVAYQYFDGLGRPIQSVDVKGSPTYNDVVVHQAYDAFGREDKKYLPYTAFPGNGLFKDDAAIDQAQFYNPTHGLYNGAISTDSHPYATTLFEASPMNRTVQQGSPGAQWQPNNKSIYMDYQLNKRGSSVQGEDVIPIWSITEVTINSVTEYVLTTPDNYETGTLFISITTDEQGKQVREYIDKQGKTIAKKVQYVESIANTYTDSDWAITFYVYDSYNRLRFVLQPEFWSNLSAYSGAANNVAKRDFLGRLTFEYRYDGRNRMVYKKVPDAAPIEMVYDSWDRLVLSRDGVQKENGKWFFTKYDALNRPILTGEVSSSNSRAAMISAVNAMTNRYEIPASGNTIGYTVNRTYPEVTTANIYTITYYDTYAFKSNISLGAGYDYAGSHHTQPTGLPTATKERVLGTNTWLVSVNYYDDRYRSVHTVSDDHLENKNKTTNTYYGITDWVTTSSLVHGASKLTSVTTTAYDHRGRVLHVMQSMDSAPAVMVVANKYNELGQLIEKNQHSVDGGKTFLQSIDQRYNIRGWLTHINNRELTNDGLVNNDANDLFGMELNYNTGVTVGSDNIPAQYNGNISSIAWKTNNLVDAPEEKIYGFNYDPLNRLQHAKYAKRNGGSWSADVGMFNEDNISYDRNGNIGHLERKAKIEGASAIIDILNYTYAGLGNQLTKVDDASGYWNRQTHSSTDFGFTENMQVTPEYIYDNNGNMIEDDNKGIFSITYNHLNLPVYVVLNPIDDRSRTIEYTYSASGTKLKKVAKLGDETISETDYIGGIQYDKGQLAFVQMGEGRITKIDTKWEYEYHLRDHLGNTRVVYGMLQDVDAFVATMETELATEEAGKFTNMTNQHRTIAAGNTTPKTKDMLNADEAIELNGYLGKAIGPTKMLQVKNGERVSMEVFVKCPDITVNSNAVIASLATAVTGAFGLVNTAESSYQALSNYTPGTAGAGGREPGLPKAYLCYMLFNTSYAPIQFGYAEAHDVSKDYFEKLALDEIMPVDGYLYVFIANESNVSAAASAYFDDFSVLHYKSTSSLKVTQVQDYYPFGLAFNSFREESATANQYKFQGQEHQDDFNIGWIQFKWRSYDPSIGRFTTIDPLAAKYTYNSTYAFSENDVINSIELEGLERVRITFFSPMQTKEVQKILNKVRNVDYIEGRDRELINNSQKEIERITDYGLKHGFVDPDGKKSDYVLKKLKEADIKLNILVERNLRTTDIEIINESGDFILEYQGVTDDGKGNLRVEQIGERNVDQDFRNWRNEYIKMNLDFIFNLFFPQQLFKQPLGPAIYYGPKLSNGIDPIPSTPPPPPPPLPVINPITFLNINSKALTIKDGIHYS